MVVGWVVSVVMGWVVGLASWWLNGNGVFIGLGVVRVCGFSCRSSEISWWV